MVIEGKFTLKAPSKKVWDTLLHPEMMGFWILGVEKIEHKEEG